MADQDLSFAITAEDRFAGTFARLRRDIAGTRGAMDGLVSRAGAVSGALGAIGAGAAAVGLTAVGAQVRRLIDDIDALNDAADATGATVESLSALEDVAMRNGATLDTVTSAALKLNKVLSDATPDSPMAKALARIGLDAAALRQQDPAQAVKSVADALAGYADDGAKARLTQELFGKSTKELAAFLKDLADTQRLSATVTSDQAAEAERFNKELAALSANVTQAARSLASDLVSALNKSVQAFRESREAGASWYDTIFNPKRQMQLLGLDTYFSDIGRLKREIKSLEDTQARQGLDALLVKRLAGLRDELALIEKRNRALADSGAGGGRGFVNPPVVRPSVGEPAAAARPARSAGAQAPSVSEAERYLDALQRQADATDELTTLERALRDIANDRLDGLTPRLRANILALSQEIDLKREKLKLDEREVGFQKLLADADQRRADRAMALLEQTPSGRRASIVNQADDLQAFSGRIGESDPRQQQVLEALQRLRKEMDEIDQPAEQAASAYDKLADSIEKSMDRATSAVLDFAISGKGSADSLFASFGRDILREMIEEPIRDTAKSAAKALKDMFKGLGEGGGLGGLGDLFSGLFGGGSGGGGIFSAIGSFFGFTGRANGGAVKAGELVRWQEGGREWFVPGADGRVVTQAQMRGAGTVAPTYNITIHGATDPAAVQRQIEVALARNNAQLARSMRTGGAYAAA